jgi:hydrogenase maturation protease
MSCANSAAAPAGHRPMPPLIFGIGNRERGDDGVGRQVAARLASLGVAAIEHSGDGADLLTLWPAGQAVIVIDAMESAGAPGTIRRFDAVAAPLPAGVFTLSSHALGLAFAIEMARALGRLPPALTVIGIEIEQARTGAALSPAVAAAADRLAGELMAELVAAPAAR